MFFDCWFRWFNHVLSYFTNQNLTSLIFALTYAFCLISSAQWLPVNQSTNGKEASFLMNQKERLTMNQSPTKPKFFPLTWLTVNHLPTKPKFPLTWPNISSQKNQTRTLYFRRCHSKLCSASSLLPLRVYTTTASRLPPFQIHRPSQLLHLSSRFHHPIWCCSFRRASPLFHPRCVGWSNPFSSTFLQRNNGYRL